MTDSPDNQVPQAAQPQPYPPPYPPQPPAARALKQGPSVLKIVLIVVAIFVGLGLIGAGVIGYGIYRVAKSVQTTSTSSQPITGSDLGIAIYPGATQGKGSLRMTIAGQSMVTANYLTQDAKDKVLAFYKDQIGPDAHSSTTADGGDFVLTRSPGDSLTIKVTQVPGANDGNTQIVIVHVSKAAAK